MEMHENLTEQNNALSVIEQKKFTDIRKALSFIEQKNFNEAAEFLNNKIIENDSIIEFYELKAIASSKFEDWQDVSDSLLNALDKRGYLSEDLYQMLNESLIMTGNEDAVHQIFGIKDTQIELKGIEWLDSGKYRIKFSAPRKGARITLDIYPSSDPRHPERHFGVWEFEVKHQHEYYVVLNFKSKEIECGPNVIIVSGNKYEYLEDNHYNFILSEVSDNKLIPCDSVGHYLGEARNIGEIEVVSQPKLKSAVWFLTWKCNFKCAYCWEVQRIIKGELQPEPYKDYKEWVNAWNRLKPEILDISGGEPFLQPNFISLINELDPKIKIAITTNLSFDVVDFVQKVDPAKIISLTFSYHPTQKMSREQFAGKVLLVKNRGFSNITVNYVTWPEQIWQIEDNKNYFEKIVGVRFHVDPYAPTPGFPYKYSLVESEYIQKFVEPNRSHAFGNEEIFNVACSGGVNHISVEPDGSAYRCIQDKVTHKPKIGNILEEVFNLHDKKTFCDQYHVCPGCDRDKVDITKLVTSKSSKKLISIEIAQA